MIPQLFRSVNPNEKSPEELKQVHIIVDYNGKIINESGYFDSTLFYAWRDINDEPIEGNVVAWLEPEE